MKHSSWQAWLTAVLGIAVMVASVVAMDYTGSAWCVLIIGVGMLIAVPGTAAINRAANF